MLKYHMVKIVKHQHVHFLLVWWMIAVSLYDDACNDLIIIYLTKWESVHDLGIFHKYYA